MFDTILVPVDENTLSLRAVATAVSLAEALSGKVALLHVALPLPAYTAAPAAAMELPPETMRAAAESYGNTVLDGFRSRIPAEVFAAAILRHARRSVWEEIIAAAEEGGGDLIVMGTHGRDGVVRALMGSVAERVARHADVPVMLIR
jgi:nucleotide-binding universal stress UspA family protein